MKLINKLLCLAAIAGAFVSCDKDYDLPPLTEPTFTIPQDAKTTTIAELRETYKGINKQDTSYVFTEDIYLRGRVISSDFEGNVYKEIVIEDETGGIGISVDQSNTYTDYPFGQEVVLNLKGLDVYFYNTFKIGSPNGDKNRTPYKQLTQSLHRVGFAQPADAKPHVCTDLKELNNEKYYYTLQLLKNVEFVDAGKKKFSAEIGSMPYEWNRPVKATNGSTVDIHTSPYCKFANDLLPEGRGDILGIAIPFSKRGEVSIQFTVCSINNFKNFTPSTGGDGEENEGGEDKPISGDFKVNFEKSESLAPFTIEDNKLGEGLSFVWKLFKHDTYGNCAKASAHVGGKEGHDVESDSRIISPLIDLTSKKNAVLAVNHCGNYFSNMAEEVSVEAKAEGGEWVKLTANELPDGKSYNYVMSNYDLNKFVGKKIQVALHYTSTPKSAGTWQVKSVEIKGEAGGEVKPETKAYYSQDFSVKGNEKLPKPWPSFISYVDKLQTKGKFATSDEHLTLRSNQGKNCLWFKGGYENWVEFQEINVEGAKEVMIVADISANLYNEGEEDNLNGLEVEIGEKTYTFPSTPVKNKDQSIHTLSLKLPVVGDKLTFRIKSNKDVIKTGLRLFKVSVEPVK